MNFEPVQANGSRLWRGLQYWTLVKKLDMAAEPLNVREVWLSNMYLLGLRPALCEEKYHVALERDMFEHINKKGSEAVLHFLFCRLDPQLSSEVFR